MPIFLAVPCKAFIQFVIQALDTAFILVTKVCLALHCLMVTSFVFLATLLGVWASSLCMILLLVRLLGPLVIKLIALRGCVVFCLRFFRRESRGFIFGSALKKEIGFTIGAAFTVVRYKIVSNLASFFTGLACPIAFA